MVPFFMKSTFVFILLFASSILLASKTTEYNSAYKKAFSLISQLRFDEATALIQEQKKLDPDNKVGNYLEGAILFTSVFANEDPQAFADSEGQIDYLVSEIEDVADDNPWRGMFLGEMYLAQATLNAKFKNNLKAAWQFYKAYQLLTENDKKFPNFIPNKLPLGVLYSAIGSLPDEYRNVASFFGLKGTVSQGVGLINKAFWRISANSDLKFYRPYAGFIYSFLTHQLGTNTHVSPASLGLKVEESGFLIYAQAIINVSEGKPEEALQWLDKRPTSKRYYPFPMLDYFQGKLLLGLDNDRAPKYLHSYLKKAKFSYVKSSYRYLAWHYILKGNKKAAEQMRLQVLMQGDVGTGADQQALKEAKKGFNPILVKARVLFDVAKYNQAAELLRANSIDKCCSSADEKVEYYYRSARIKEEQGFTTEAIEDFEKALKVEGSTSSFEKANSALQLGFLYEKLGNEAKAKEFYKSTLSFSGYPFYAGTQQKAKTGLDRIKDKSK